MPIDPGQMLLQHGNPIWKLFVWLEQMMSNLDSIHPDLGLLIMILTLFVLVIILAVLVNHDPDLVRLGKKINAWREQRRQNQQEREK